MARGTVTHKALNMLWIQPGDAQDSCDRRTCHRNKVVPPSDYDRLKRGDAVSYEETGDCKAADVRKA